MLGERSRTFPANAVSKGASSVLNPETARLLGYNGAEVILFPSAGYDPRLMPARAADQPALLPTTRHAPESTSKSKS